MGVRAFLSPVRQDRMDLLVRGVLYACVHMHLHKAPDSCILFMCWPLAYQAEWCAGKHILSNRPLIIWFPAPRNFPRSKIHSIEGTNGRAKACTPSFSSEDRRRS